MIDFEVFLQLRCTEMLLIYNSNGNLENVKAEVETQRDVPCLNLNSYDEGIVIHSKSEKISGVYT